MFSPDVQDHSFSPGCSVDKNKKLEKRKWSYKNFSDCEDSETRPKRYLGKKSLNNSHDSILKNSRLSSGSTSNNNSFSHPALIKSGISHSTPVNDGQLSVTKGRRSLALEKFAIQDDEINDDAEEIRAERENQISSQDSTLEKELKPLEILAHCLDSDLSTEQLAAHLASCIELNAANKINISNAFNLKLIDYMVVLLKRNDKTMKDFPTMSCSLDASTRIYACRVDNVHAGVMELVSGLAGTIEKQRKIKSKDSENQNERSQSDEDNDEDDDKVNNRRLKKRKTVLASSEKAVSRNSIESAHWMTRRAIEPNFTVLFNTAKITQSSDAGLSLLKDVVELVSKKTQRRTKALHENLTVDLEFPELIKIRASLYSSSFKFDWDEDTEQQQTSQASVMNDVFGESKKNNELLMGNEPMIMDSFSDGVLPETQSDNDAYGFDNSFVPDEPNFDIDEPDEPKPDVIPENILEESKERCELKKNTSKRKHIDALNLINSKMILANDENDYSYMNTDDLPLIWAGPDHWKPILKRGKQPVAVAEFAEKKSKKLKRKTPEEFRFDDFSMIDSIFNKKINAVHQSKAIKRWSETKVTFPMQKVLKFSLLYRSFLRKTLFWKPLVKTDTDGEEIKIETEYTDELEDTSQDDVENSIFQGFDDNFDQDDQDSAHDDQSENGDDEDNVFDPPAIKQDVNEPPHTSEMLLTNKLVPVPRMVNCSTITYATVPKRVNMKHLKETCWNLMDLESDKENEDKNTIEHRIEKTAQFSKLYLELPKNLPSDSRNDLSPALAFLSVLHLANEKMLQLYPVDKEFDKENNSDFLIKRFV